jgi:hypothetical protein
MVVCIISSAYIAHILHFRKPKQPILYRNRAKIHEKMGDTKAAASDQAKADSFGKALIDY